MYYTVEWSQTPILAVDMDSNVAEHPFSDRESSQPQRMACKRCGGEWMVSVPVNHCLVTAKRMTVINRRSEGLLRLQGVTELGISYASDILLPLLPLWKTSVTIAMASHRLFRTLRFLQLLPQFYSPGISRPLPSPPPAPPAHSPVGAFGSPTTSHATMCIHHAYTSDHLVLT